MIWLGMIDHGLGLRWITIIAPIYDILGRIFIKSTECPLCGKADIPFGAANVG
jgi:hypothetical protein